MASFRRVGETDELHGYVWRVVKAEFEDPTGERFVRHFVRSPGAVSALPLEFEADGTPFLTLVQQWRPPLERDVWEIPAGMRDVADEPIEVTARRELVEEVGLVAGHVEWLTSINPSAGLTDAETHIFVATDLTAVARETHGPEEDHSVVRRFAIAEVVAMIERGDIKDAKTCVGVLLLARRLDAGWRP